jgi:signal transduction histidine kinase
MSAGLGDAEKIVNPTRDNGEMEALRERMRYVGLSAEDLAEVRRAAPTLRPLLPQLVERFYRHLMAIPETAAYLKNPEQVRRLHFLQVQYLESLLEARVDEAYLRSRRRIGVAHAEIGIAPDWFLGAYATYTQAFFQALLGADASAPERSAPAFLAIQRLLYLDIGLALDSYHAQFTQRLRTALDLYTRSNAELREYAHLASHDLKTPLATVAALCEEFLDQFSETTPAEGRKLIEAARIRAMGMKAMIDELLVVSEAAAAPGQRSRVSLQHLFDDVMERLRLEIGEIHAEIRFPTESLEVYTHAGRLREVLYQLLANSLKFLDKHPGKVAVAVAAREGEIELRVSDNGPGIAPEVLPTIFAPFRRLAQHSGVPGTGLGLYFVRRIVEELGGRVWAESTPGQGSVFTIALPLTAGGSSASI